MVKVIKTAMLGMGSVNRNLLKIISSKKDRLAEEYDIAFKIIAVTDSSGIAAIIINEGENNDKNGLDMISLVELKEKGGRISDLSSFQGSGKERVFNILNTLDIDLLFEATPCCVGNLETIRAAAAATEAIVKPNGEENEEDSEALRICRAALTRGVSVVLANKGPLVDALGELRDLASSSSGRQGQLEYSATVCGGLPILNIGKRDMIVGNITKIKGVFNGTSNFIIDAMANQAMTFHNAIREAQIIGAAEADPTLDTGGWDTAFKLLIIVNTIIQGTNITLADVSVEGIDDLSPEIIQIEAERGNTIKLVATADIDSENGRNKYSVRPVSHPINSFLGSITGWEMGIEIHSDIYGISYHKLYEKEPIPTAASMLRDAVHIFN